MIDATEEVLSFIYRKTEIEFRKDRKLILSSIKEIEIIGEAASKISPDFKKQHPEIPWDEIIRTRNRLIHGYFDINLNIVWKTVARDLPDLAKKLKELI